MDRNTPLENRLYFRCHDCLAMSCVEMNIGHWKRAHRDTRNPLQCGICGGRLEFLGQVTGDGSAWKHQIEVCDCDTRCQDALGPMCTCRCGGINHGVGWKSHVETDASGKVKVTPEGEHDKRLAIAAEYRAALQAASEKMVAMLGDYWTAYKQRAWINKRAAWDACHNAESRWYELQKGKQHKSRMDKIERFVAWLDQVPGWINS